MKACRNCHMIVEEHEICPNCNSELSKEWQGYIVILDFSRSEIAQKMNIRMNGRFAIKVK